MKVEGSPPHTWGIPSAAPSAQLETEDHPHIHGEYQFLIQKILFPRGSPPHTWGILPNFGGPSHVVRITPTYMGNTRQNNFAL